MSEGEQPQDTTDRLAQARAVEVVQGVQLTEEQLAVSATVYNVFRDEHDEAIKIGVFDKETTASLEDPDTVLIQYSSEGGDNIFVPLLIPAEKLEWYNTELFKRSYGEDTPFYYFAHPPLPDDEEQQQKIWDTLRAKLEEGAVIIMDQYQGAETASDRVMSGIAGSSGDETIFELQKLGGGELERKVDIFVAPVMFNGVDQVQEAPSVFDIYDQAIASGEIERNDREGVTLERSIEGEEAERMWEIYENPFDELGEEDPTYAGFDKESLLEILKNPDVVKVVNRVDGKISTLCFFVQDFKQAPWFNARYYEKNHPEYASTNNIFMFPGIVSDENMRGNNYSLDVIDLATKLLAKRGTNILITFECTEISTQYIPNIVKAAVENSGVAEVVNLDQPVSVMDYMAIVKKAA